MAASKLSRFQESAKVKAADFRGAFTSKETFLHYIQNPESVNETDPERARWTNRDLDPSPPEQRNWNWFNYCTYYFGLSFGNWTLGSTMIGIGLNWWQSIIVIFVSQMIASTAMLYNSKAASTYHIGYPCVARSVYGMWGSYYPVTARAVLAIIWYAVQLYTGASYLCNMLQAVFGHHYTDIPNGMAANMGFTTQQMLGFFLFWLIHIPFVFLRPYQLRGFFAFKSIISFPAMFGLFIYCMATTKGQLGSMYGGSAPSGGQFGWFFMWCINSGMGNTATLITNQPDLARWAKTPKSPTWAQMIVNPVFTTLSATLGILATSAVNNKWGTTIWNQWDLMTAIMERNWRPEVRFAIFLCSLCWMISILATNVAANMIPFGADSSMLWPKYLTITRGQAIVHLLGYAVCPWKIMYSASTFITFLAGYGIFMGPVVAIMICEYYIVSRGNIFVPSLYIGNKSNENYWFKGGWNVQAFVAYIIAIALPFPGFVGTLGPKVSAAAENLGHLGWCLSFVTAFVIYYLLNLVWPHENVKNTKNLRREELADGTIVDGIDTTSPAEEFSVSLSEKK